RLLNCDKGAKSTGCKRKPPKSCFVYHRLRTTGHLPLLLISMPWHSEFGKLNLSTLFFTLVSFFVEYECVFICECGLPLPRRCLASSGPHRRHRAGSNQNIGEHGQAGRRHTGL